MGRKEATVIFAASSLGRRGWGVEVVVSEDLKVYYTRTRPGGEGDRVETLRRRRQEVEDCLWEIQDIVAGKWRARYGQGDPTGPGGWMVILEVDRRFYKWQGCGEHPEDWAALCRAVRRLAGRPFPAEES